MFGLNQQNLHGFKMIINKYCMSCHKREAITKIGRRVLCKQCNEARLKAQKKPVKYNEDWQSEDRARAIAQNGNDGSHYNQS